MLLAVDVGNTQTVVGVFEGERIVRQWRVTSLASRTGDEIALTIELMLREARIQSEAVTAVAIASVVPSLTPEYRLMGERLFHVKTVVIDGSVDLGLALLVNDPASVGPDRIVNVLAARERHGAPAIIVDMGTATTFDVLDAEGNYAGGAIAPGIGISAEALFQRGARLARIEVRPPARATGKTTEEHLQSGIFFGAVGQVDEIVRRLAAEVRGKPRVIATGGLAASIAAHSHTIELVDPDLTLHGIRLAAGRLAPDAAGA